MRNPNHGAFGKFIWNSLSKLVAAASQGEDVVISKRGRPVVRLVRVDEETPVHTGSQSAEWLTRNPPPAYSVLFVSGARRADRGGERLLGVIYLDSCIVI